MKGGTICKKCGGNLLLIVEDDEEATISRSWFYPCKSRIPKDT